MSFPAFAQHVLPKHATLGRRSVARLQGFGGVEV